ncbi:MAG TPA: heavy-metal-associated domain-containing protein [Gemmatimonadota bacterium]|nr:heavy-metal-associated domain-containing protein [Gemmatimonadota bacterium]
MSQNGRKCHVDPVRTAVDPTLLERSATAFLAVSGMGCPNCAARVRNALVLTEGVVEAEIDHVAGLAVVSYLSEDVDVETLRRSIASAAEGTHHRYGAVSIPPGAIWDA